MDVLAQIMGVNEAGELWGLSPDQVKRLCRDGKVHSVQIGKTWIIAKGQPNPKQRERNKKEEFEMNKHINEIIEQVENGKVKLQEDYDFVSFSEGAEEENIGFEIDSEDYLKVYFAEKQYLADLRADAAVNEDIEKELEEALENANGLDDRYNFDKVVAYDAGAGIVWL